MNRKALVSRVVVGAVALVVNTGIAVAQPPNPGTGTSFGRVMNVGSGPATVVVQYIDPSGNVAATRSVNNLAQFGATTVSPSATDVTPALPGGWTGAVVVSSDQPLVGLTYINWVGGGGGVGFCQVATGLCGDDKHSADYSATTAPSTDLFFPSVAKRAQEAGRLFIQNANPPGGPAATVYINFYDRFGNAFSGNPVIRTIPAGASITFDMFTESATSAPFFNDFLGSAYVTSTQPIAGAAIHTWFYGSFGYTAKPRASASTNVLFPKVVRRCLAGQGCVNADNPTEPNFTDSTGIVCANTSETLAANITITFTNRAGTVESVFTDVIPPLSSRGYNTRFAAPLSNLSVAARDNIRGLDQGGNSVQPAFVGSAQVTSNRPLVCIAKQLYDKDAAAYRPGEPNEWTRQSLGYNGINLSDAKTEIYLPIAWRITGQPACPFWRYTGLIVQNATNSNASITVRVYGNDGTLLATFNDPIQLPGFASRGYNTRFDTAAAFATFLQNNLPSTLVSSFDGTMRLTSTQPVVAVAENWQNCTGSIMTDSNITELN